MGRMADREFLRRWVENTYAPRKEMESEFAALKGRIQSMEERQKEEHAENSNRLDQIISILSARAGKRVGD